MKTRHAIHARIEPLESRIAPAAVISLGLLDGKNGFKVSGANDGDYLGQSVQSAGDINGDGYDDVIVGEGGNNVPAGEVFVVFGKAGGFPESMSVAALDGINGFKITGVTAGDRAGSTVSGAGDVNGDGFDDLLVSAPSANAVYVVYGKASGFGATFSLASLNGPNGFKITGVEPDAIFGDAIASTDVNHDGRSDVIITAWRAAEGGAYRGAAYVVFGKSASFGPAFSVGSLNGSNGFKLSGVADNDLTGRAVAAADVNGDGFGDIILSADAANEGGTKRGAVYVVYGKASGFSASNSLALLDGSNGFKLSGVADNDFAGGAVGGAGDVNGDGIGDLIVASRYASEGGSYRGAAYVVFGHTGAGAAVVPLGSLNGTNGFKLSGIGNDDYTGSTVGAAGDWNGDGFGDILVTVPGASGGGHERGAVYLVFGKANGFAAATSLGSLDASSRVQIQGASDNDSLYQAYLAGDVNGDGISDVVLGAISAPEEGTNRGAVYVVFGPGVPPKISVADVTMSEGNLGGRNLIFHVTLSREWMEEVTVNYIVAGGTAVDGPDFLAPLPGVLHFAPGQTAIDVAVPVFGDTVLEGDETLTITLSNPVEATIERATAMGTITNDDAVPSVSISDASVVEGNAGTANLIFNVTLSNASASTVTVNYATAGGTAVGGVDFAALAPGVLTFAPGETSKSITVSVLGDTGYEANETLQMALSNSSGAALAHGTGVGIILNDDVVPSVSIADATVTEGDSGTKNLTFNVSLSAPTTEAVLVPYAISEGTAKSGVDFAGPLTGLLVVPAGMSTGQIIVPVLGDATFESDETLTVTLLAPGNASIARGVATGTILNNDAAPAISIADATISEGDEGMKNLTFTVTLSNPADHDVTVSIDTVDGTAREIFDFAGIHSGNLLIPAGMTSTQVTVLVKGDGRYELDETFSVVLTDPVNATLVRDTATGTIQNDDAPPEVSAADVSMLEGADGTSNLTFTLTLSAPSDVFVTLFYVIGGGTAVGGEDFVPMASGFHSAIFQPGTTSTQVSIPILGDHVVESDETVVLTMGTPMYATITDFTATGTILNDDVPPPPQIFAYSSPVTEGEPGTMTDLVFHVELTHASASPVSMSYRFNDFPADGFAQFGIDFTGPAPGVLTFAPGEVSKELHLSVAGDAVYEKDEIVRLELSNPSGGTFTSLLQVYAQVDSKILNDDVAPTISVADASVVEGDLGDKNLVFTVSLSNPSDEPVSVWFHATAGTALEGIDVVLPESDTLVFAPGETSLSVAVKVHGDLTVEGEETVGLTLSNPNHGTIGDGDATGQILDNDVSQGVTLLKKNLATFTDVDGDVVTVKVSKGTLDITDLLLTPEGLGYRFKALHLPMDDGKFNGAAVTITAKPSAAGGDGLVDLGRLDATGVKLGKVSVDGDLRQASAAAMASLTVYSLGERAAGAPDEELTSTISGKLGALTVKTDASHVTVHAGSIGTLKALALEDVTIAAGAITAMTAQSLENTDVFVQGGIGITALKSLNVSGSVRHSRVLAGYNAEGLGMYGGVKIGAVKVGGQWEASEIVAGVKTGADFLFGTDDDVSMGGGKVIAKIASITIAGAVLGTSDVTDDAFGFVADEIGALSVGKAKVPLVKGAHNDLSPRVLAWTGDVVVREVEDALG